MNAGTGVRRLNPTFDGESHEDIHHNIQFFMTKKIKERAKKQQNDPLQTAMKVMFTQMSATVGFKLFGEKAISAMIKELKQLEEGLIPGKKVIEPIDPDTLTE